MSRRTLDRSHTYQEVQAHFDHHESVVAVRQSGSHRTYTSRNGNSVTVPIGHRGDVPRGLLRAICKAAVTAGLVCLVVAGVAVMFATAM